MGKSIGLMHRGLEGKMAKLPVKPMAVKAKSYH